MNKDYLRRYATNSLVWGFLYRGSLFISILVNSLSAQIPPEFVIGNTLPPEILNRTLRACDDVSGGSMLAYGLTKSGGGNQLVWLTFFGSWRSSCWAAVRS
ncbi:hypothetical protein HQ531_05190 [bacterium]|nr:hypothetical protein [bacterium]